MANRLFFGDNLDVLRAHVADASVDLIYLDPPFNSDADYNVLFRAPAGQDSDAQVEAFQDTWRWGDSAARAFDDVLRHADGSVSTLLRAFRSFMGESDMMAYLAMMCVRLIELRRVLRPTGSLYLHCDPTASHYLKLLLDGVMTPARFRSEIIWKRTSGHSDAKRYGPSHDTILFYANGDDPVWNAVFQPYDPEYVETYYRYTDDSGRRFMSGDLSGGGGGGRGGH